MGEKSITELGFDTEQVAQIGSLNARRIAGILGKNTLNGTSYLSLENAPVAFSRPDGIYSSAMKIQRHPLKIVEPEGISIIYSPDPDPRSKSGIKRTVKIRAESIGNYWKEFSDCLSLESAQTLRAFVKNPKKFKTVPDQLMELTAEEDQFVKGDKTADDEWEAIELEEAI